MGNYVNKFFSHNNEIEKEEIKDPPCMDKISIEKNMQTPPTIHKTLPMDPRSVTNGIDRTPIEVNSTPVGLNRRVISAIPKHLQTRPYLETDIDKVMLCLTPKKHVPRVTETAKSQLSDMENNTKVPSTFTVNNIIDKKLLTAIGKERYDILGLDPRSPAADFDRTPILMPKSIERLKARSQESLHRRGSYDTDIFYPRFSYCEMSSEFNVTEIQALPDLATCAMKKLDLVKVDYDDKCSESESSYSSHSSRSENISENGEDEDEIEMISHQDNYSGTCINKNIEQKETCVNDNDIIKIWRDSLVLNKVQKSVACESDDVQIIRKGISKVPKEEVIITLDDSISKGTLRKQSKSESDKTKVDIIGKKQKILKSEKIIADEKKILNPNDKNVNELMKIRTPLGNRSNNGQMQTLLTNSPQQMFRNKGILPKMLQENTPPHKRYVAKSRLNSIEWDPDSTVII
ncbi:hypothetical protein ANTPLA_LOCUS6953 [Anthophora plagiata]